MQAPDFIPIVSKTNFTGFFQYRYIKYIKIWIEKGHFLKNQRRVPMSSKGWSLSPKSKQTQNFQLFGQNWTKLGWFGLGN